MSSKRAARATSLEPPFGLERTGRSPTVSRSCIGESTHAPLVESAIKGTGFHDTSELIEFSSNNAMVHPWASVQSMSLFIVFIPLQTVYMKARLIRIM